MIDDKLNKTLLLISVQSYEWKWVFEVLIVIPKHISVPLIVLFYSLQGW